MQKKRNNLISKINITSDLQITLSLLSNLFEMLTDELNEYEETLNKFLDDKEVPLTVKNTAFNLQTYINSKKKLNLKYTDKLRDCKRLVKNFENNNCLKFGTLQKPKNTVKRYY